jgi:hypothetical protein
MVECLDWVDWVERLLFYSIASSPKGHASRFATRKFEAASRARFEIEGIYMKLL